MPVYPNPYYKKVDTYKIVKSAGDLGGTLDSTKVYVIDGFIDMGSQQIVVPEGGLTIRGNGFNVSKLYSTENNYTMIVDGGTYSGDLFIDSMSFEVTGTSSKVFDVDNDGNFNAIEFNSVNFLSCTDCGDIRNYRQMLFRNNAWINGSKGFTLHGPMAGIALLDSIMLLFNNPTGYKLFTEGTSLTMSGSFRSDLNAITVPSDWVFFDWSDSVITADGGLLLNGVRTTSSDALPNFDSTSVKAYIKNCRGINNTFVGGNYTISAGASTTIAASDTLYKMAGTTTYNNLAWVSGSTDNAFKSETSIEGDVKITGVLSFTGVNNNEMAVQIRQWDDSAAGYINIGPEFKATLNGGAAGTRAENLSFEGIARLQQNDRIEIWIKNITAANDISSTVGGSVTITERAP